MILGLILNFVLILGCVLFKIICFFMWFVFFFAYYYIILFCLLFALMGSRPMFFWGLKFWPNSDQVRAHETVVPSPNRRGPALALSPACSHPSRPSHVYPLQPRQAPVSPVGSHKERAGCITLLHGPWHEVFLFFSHVHDSRPVLSPTNLPATQQPQAPAHVSTTPTTPRCIVPAIASSAVMPRCLVNTQQL